ncbi:MAG: hypothetical protein LBQ66_08040 [Planctomycetaceae bacterium]|nr:hypothetical protein [Planctomycetaceae bacterium]
MWYNEGKPPSMTTSRLTPVVLFKFWNKSNKKDQKIRLEKNKLKEEKT